MKNKLLNRLIDPNPLSIINKIPKFLSPLFSYVVLQEMLRLKCGHVSNELIFKIGKSVGKELTKRIISINKNKSKSRIIDFFLKEMENLGFGKSKLVRFNSDKKTCVISNISNPIAKQYKKTFGQSQEVVDYFISGAYSGCLSNILNVDCFFIEKNCTAMNDSACIFNLSLQNFFKHEIFDQKEINGTIKWNNLYSALESEYPNRLIQKIIRLKQIKLDSGQIRVWNVYCAFFPLCLFPIIYAFLNRKNMDVSNELGYMASIQAKIAILFQINKFGIKNGIDTFNSLLNQLELFGVGKGQVIGFSRKKIVVKFSNSYSLYQYKSMFKDIDLVNDVHLNGGSIIGMVQYALRKRLKTISHRIINNDIYYSIQFTDKVSLVDTFRKNIKNKKIINIIEEKMKHKYYLLG